MNKNKLASYKLTASIHTFAVRSKNRPVLDNIDSGIVQDSNYSSRTDTFLTRINPNKSEYGDLFSYSEYRAFTTELFHIIGIPDCTYWRTDLRLDSYVDNFKEFYKLNFLLINLLAIVLNEPNRQAGIYMLSQTKEFADVSAKNQYMEAKYYNKKYQTHDKDETKARLELRCLKNHKSEGLNPLQAKDKWFKLLDKLPDCYDNLQIQCNENLLKAYISYKEHRGKIKIKGDYISAFLSDFNNNVTIFTRTQLIQFFVVCGIDKSKAAYRADNLIERCRIEFFTRADLKIYIVKIKSAINDFFNC